MNNDEFLTVSDLAERYKCSKATIFRWSKDAEVNLPSAVQIGATKLFKLNDLVAWEATHVKHHGLSKAPQAA